MKKTFINLFSGILLVVLMFGIGYYRGWDAGTAGGPLIIEQEKILYQPIQREYQFMKDEELLQELTAYDTGIPTLDFKTSGARRIRADAGLNGRTWSREVTVNIPSSSKNWKYAIGFGVGILCFSGGMWLYRKVK